MWFIFSALAKDPQWQKLAMEAETLSTLATGVIANKAWRNVEKIGGAFLGNDPDEIIDQVVSGIYQNGSAYNEWMKGRSSISWNRAEIRKVVGKLIEASVIAIKPSYSLEISPRLHSEERKRVSDSMKRMYQQIISRLPVEGKLKLEPQVPTLVTPT